MSKRQLIETYFEEYQRNEISKEEVALIAKTTPGYVYDVFLKVRVTKMWNEETKLDRAKILEATKKEIKVPNFNVEEEIKGLDVDDLVKEINGIKIIPKVNLLTDGRVELIYKSRM